MILTPHSRSAHAGVEPSWSVAQLLAALAEKTGVAPAQQEIMAGFPPKTIALPFDPDAATVASLDLPAGEPLTVRELPAPPAPASNGAVGNGSGAALDTTGMVRGS